MILGPKRKLIISAVNAAPTARNEIYPNTLKAKKNSRRG
ncbi:uncharacterized protein METZ01_LOCUS157419 [marine metagenome]|jgi:hypothetical protein|uniref:Uncharacterized protein n=1 Tax=marine metagenome TaxID=408172 RepID=A0A382ASN8_9ZZZZ